ncbi:hypothetical protein JCM11251_005076 [Rhodosporidiobolus azoricus]
MPPLRLLVGQGFARGSFFLLRYATSSRCNVSIPGIPSPVLPPGSLVVISGSTGFIGSHIVDETFKAGYRVRGTTRNVDRNQGAVDYFRERYGEKSFELVEVKEMGNEDAFLEAAKDALGFIHVANDMGPKDDPQVSVDLAVQGALNALRAAATAGHKVFAYTSSSFAATQPKPGVAFRFNEQTYNEEAVEKCSQAVAGSKEFGGDTIYSASKVTVDQAIYAWAGDMPPTWSSTRDYPTSARWVRTLCTSPPSSSDFTLLSSNPLQH